MKPTIFGNVTPSMTIAQEDILGSVIAIMPYETQNAAVKIVNDSPCGLSGAVWSVDT